MISRRESLPESAQNRRWGPILVGTGASDDGTRAIDAAVELGAELDAEIWIVTVIDAISETTETQFARAEEGSSGDATDGVARDILNEAESTLTPRGQQTFTPRQAGNCAEELVAVDHEIGDGDVCGRARRRRASEPIPDR